MVYNYKWRKQYEVRRTRMFYDGLEEQRRSVLPTLLLIIGFIALGAILFLNM